MPSLWQDMLTMKRYLALSITMSLACQGEGDIYHDQVPSPQAVNDLSVREHTEQVILENGRAQWEFQINSKTQSFSLYVDGLNDAEYLITELESPDGVFVRSEATSQEAASGLGLAAAPFFSANRSVGDHGGTSILVPNNPRLKITQGMWQATLQSTQSTEHTVKITRLEQRASGRPASIRIPLNIHLSGAGGIRHNRAGSHPRMRRALSQLETIFSRVNIDLEPIRFFEISPDFQIIEDVTLQNEQGLNLLRSAEDGQGINLFIIERFEGDDVVLGTIGGVSAAIPGDPRSGGRFSGVVVATSFSEDEPETDLLGLTIAHEIGHFLGLFHTEEATGFKDNIEDTNSDTPSNLMHHLSRLGFDQLTDQQGMVLRSHPAGQMP